jgi:hypothetical protein
MERYKSADTHTLQVQLYSQSQSNPIRVVLRSKELLMMMEESLRKSTAENTTGQSVMVVVVVVAVAVVVISAECEGQAREHRGQRESKPIRPLVS